MLVGLYMAMIQQLAACIQSRRDESNIGHASDRAMLCNYIHVTREQDESMQKSAALYKSLAQRDLQWSVWHCRDNVTCDVSGDKIYFVTQMDRYNKYLTKQYTHSTHYRWWLVLGLLTIASLRLTKWCVADCVIIIYCVFAS